MKVFLLSVIATVTFASQQLSEQEMQEAFKNSFIKNFHHHSK
jgi:hypothetical protein